MTLVAKLLRWYDRHGRDLPWRKTRDPYRILVSEIMLQQTQVDRVKGYYRSWLKTFPSWKELAKASNAAVLRAWSGLGYNRRALVMRDVARHVVKNGAPTTVDGWRAIKGIGSYTASAIMAFAYKEPTVPIDTNIRRVGNRLWRGVAYPTPKSDGALERTMTRDLIGVDRAYDVPQALFYLAAMHCTKVPDCSACPMRRVCPSAAKFLSGTVRTPKRMTKKANETRHYGKPHPDRIYRGRVLKTVQDASLVDEAAGLTIDALGTMIDPAFDRTHDRSWLVAMVRRLEKDGMVVLEKNRVSLVP